MVKFPGSWWTWTTTSSNTTQMRTPSRLRWRRSEEWSSSRWPKSNGTHSKALPSSDGPAGLHICSEKKDNRPLKCLMYNMCWPPLPEEQHGSPEFFADPLISGGTKVWFEPSFLRCTNARGLSALSETTTEMQWNRKQVFYAGGGNNVNCWENLSFANTTFCCKFLCNNDKLSAS